MAATLLSIPSLNELQGSTVVSTQRPFQWFANSEEQKFYFLLLCSFVAGKNADVQQIKFDQLVRLLQGQDSPDYAIPLSAVAPKTTEAWVKALEACKLGQYQRLKGVCEQITKWSRRDDPPTREELVTCAGIGMKTASFFLAYTDLSQRVAVLDVHVLKSFRAFMNSNVPVPDRPATTKAYLALEEEFLLAAEAEGIHPAVLDFELWTTTRTENLTGHLRHRREWTNQMRQLTHQLSARHSLTMAAT